ncbi:MAG: NUDIX domain-containing protein [Acidimicrobiales bacterium]
MPLPLRQGIRAVVVDDDDRILLVHFALSDWTGWATPGGGIEPGESLESAIRRELHEEVGLVDVELGPVIWERTHIFDFAEFSGQYERFFLVRTSTSEINPSFTKEELLAERLTDSRWWTLREIQESDEDFAPSELATLLETLIEDGPPETVIDTGV